MRSVINKIEEITRVPYENYESFQVTLARPFIVLSLCCAYSTKKVSSYVSEEHFLISCTVRGEYDISQN